MRKHLLACALLAITTTAAADDKKYTLADLKALVSQKSFKEAVAHLGDIAPTERNAEWQALAADAATGYVSGMSNDDYGAKIAAIESIDEAYPVVLKSPKYTKARTEIGMTGFAKCFAQDSGYWWRSNASWEVCRDHLVKFVDADPTNADLTLRAAKLYRRNVTPHGGAAGFFKKALTAAGKNAGAVCKDEDMKLVIVSGLNFPDHYDDAKTIRDIAANICWNEFKSTVQEEFKKAGETSYEKRSTCAILKAKSSLTADQTRACEKAKRD